MRGTLVSLQVGKVQRLVMPEQARVDPGHPFWTSAIFKSAPVGPVRVTRAGIDGDAQADLENHGGPDNVILAYDAEHYPVWRRELGMAELGHGSFGENFTVHGFSDDTACIGDIWRVGAELLLQVTQPRQPCYKLARRLGRADIIKRVYETSRGGWYLRVLEEGMAEAGMAIELVERRHADWPVAEAVQVMYARIRLPERAAELARLPELSARWKGHLAEK